MVQMQVDVQFISDVLRGNEATEMRITLIRYIDDEMPPDDDQAMVMFGVIGVQKDKCKYHGQTENLGNGNDFGHMPLKYLES